LDYATTPGWVDKHPCLSSTTDAEFDFKEITPSEDFPFQVTGIDEEEALFRYCLPVKVFKEIEFPSAE
jgi:hypothetical protein